MKNFFFMPLLTASGEEKSLLEELWDFFVENYFESGATYPNLGMGGSGPMLSLSSIVFGIFFGIIIASVLIVYDKRVTGGFVRQMIYVGAIGKENAMTINELEVGARSSVARSLRKSSYLKKIVKCVEEDAHYAEHLSTSIAQSLHYLDAATCRRDKVLHYDNFLPLLQLTLNLVAAAVVLRA